MRPQAAWLDQGVCAYQQLVDLLVEEIDDRDHVLDQRISSPDLGREIPSSWTAATAAISGLTAAQLPRLVRGAFKAERGGGEIASVSGRSRPLWRRLRVVKRGHRRAPRLSSLGHERTWAPSAEWMNPSPCENSGNKHRWQWSCWLRYKLILLRPSHRQDRQCNCEDRQESGHQSNPLKIVLVRAR